MKYIWEGLDVVAGTTVTNASGQKFVIGRREVVQSDTYYLIREGCILESIGGRVAAVAWLNKGKFTPENLPPNSTESGIEKQTTDAMVSKAVDRVGEVLAVEEVNK